MVKFIREISCGDEYFDDAPTHARIEIDEQLLKRIKLFQKVVKKLKANTVTEYGYRPDFLIEIDEGVFKNYSETDYRIEGCILHVGDISFWWSAYIKQTSIRIHTGDIYIDELEECLKVAQYKQEELPLLIGTLKTEEAQKLHEERMKS